MASPNMQDYIEVPQRILDFKEKHPEGSLQGDFEIRDLPDKDNKVKPHVIYTARAYRSPEDMCPGVGTASEPIPGFTSFTKGSEVMNAETSAWGRALAALGFIGNGKIATANEVRNRQADEPKKAKATSAKTSERDRTLTAEEALRLIAKTEKLGVTLEQLDTRLQAYGVEKVEEMTTVQASDLVKHFETKKAA